MKKLIYISIVLIAFPFLAKGQTLQENFIKSTTYQQPYTETEINQGNIPEDDKIETITYHDGLGRPIQSISPRAGGNKESIATYMEYDELGMQPKEFLPWASNGQVPTATALDFIQPLVLRTDIYGFYNVPKYDDTPNPYSETVYENSPLLRPVEQGAPGEDWGIGLSLGDNHTIKFEYSGNDQDNLYRLNVGFTNGDTEQPYLVFNQWYPNNSGDVTKTITKDENWTPIDGNNKTTHEFKNSLGQVFLKRTFNLHNSTQQIMNTYYVYDDFGNLTYVLSPEATKVILDGTALALDHQVVLDNFGYQYRYDKRNRLVEKKLPGKGWESMVYNYQDQVVFTQDAALKERDKWLFKKYDGLGRVIMTGIVDYTFSRASLQYNVNNDTAFWEERTLTPTTVSGQSFYYTDTTLPRNNYEIHTVNYYDDYVDHVGVTLPNDCYGINPNLSETKSLPTVSRVRVLGTDDWIVTLTGYDTKGRTIASVSHNYYLDTVDTIKMELDFVGKMTESTSTHFRTGISTVSIIDQYTYDHAGRQLIHKQKIDDEPVQLIAQNHYDELGQLVLKDVGGESTAEGYSELTNTAVSSDGIITSAILSWNWVTRLKTKGEVPLEHEGGVEYVVLQNDEHVRVGLVNAAVSDPDNDYFDYGIYTYSENGVSKIQLIVGSTSAYNGGQNYGTYQVGDTFKIKREADGNVRFYHGDNLMETVTATDDGLNAKVAFNGPADTGIKDLKFSGPILDLKLQNVDFEYNVRGWLTDINDVHDTSINNNDLFKFQINYNELFGVAYGSLVEPLYNGNIAETITKTKNIDQTKRGYGYWYDDLNRIRRANHRAGSNLENTDVNHTFTLWNVTYDLNGNIEKLRRQGYLTSQLYDDLVYSYSGNQLTEVTELSPCNCNDDGFKDDDNGGVGLIDYTYDVNGNMVSDENKNIDLIEYNHLNLPTKIVITGSGLNDSGQILYTYAADGVKMEKELVPVNGLPQSTLYAGNYVYSQTNYGDTLLQFISHPEGYIAPTPELPKGEKGAGPTNNEITYSDYDYIFQFKDIWSNIRLSYGDSNLDGVVNANTEIIQESNYFPYGLKHWGYNDITTGNGNNEAQNFKTYQGQEFTEDLNLNTHEWKYRIGDPSIGRFWQIDPLAEDYSYNSTYAFQENKLGLGIELEGLELDRQRGGLKDMILGGFRMIMEKFNVKRQMEIRGAGGDERSEIAQLESREEISYGAEQLTHGSEEFAKGSLYTTGEVLEVTGETIEVAGIVTGQPEVVAVGSSVAKAGTVAKAIVDVLDGKDMKETMIKATVGFTIGQTGDKIIKTAKKAAGGSLDNTSWSIITGTFKASETITNELIVPEISPMIGPQEEPKN